MNKRPPIDKKKKNNIYNSSESNSNSSSIHDVKPIFFKKDNKTNNKKKLLLEIDTTKSKDPNAYLSDQDLITRLETLIGSHKAGNDNVLNELSAVLDVLLSRNIINLQQYKDVINAVQNK